jgi:hypothetical protein
MLTTLYTMVFMGFVTLVFVFLPEPIIRFFSHDEEVIDYGIRALRTIGDGYIFYGVGMVMIQSLNGAGNTRTPTIINFICFWLFQIPLAYLLAIHFRLGPSGALIAIPVPEALIATLAFMAFKRGRWQKTRV